MNSAPWSARSTDDVMNNLGIASQLPQAPVSLARTIRNVSSKSIYIRESDEFEIEDDLSDLIELMANNLWS